jgi:hypothetical protein
VKNQIFSNENNRIRKTHTSKVYLPMNMKNHWCCICYELKTMQYWLSKQFNILIPTWVFTSEGDSSTWGGWNIGYEGVSVVALMGLM